MTCARSLRYAGMIFAVAFLFSLANAEEIDIRAAGSGCAYAGNVSKYVFYPSANRTYCQAVEKTKIGGDTYSCASQDHSEVLCHPFYSGLNGGKAICVPRGAKSFIQCPRDPKKVAAFVREKKLEGEQRAHLSEMKAKVCDVSPEKKKLYGFACAETARFERALGGKKSTPSRSKLEAECDNCNTKAPLPEALEKPADQSRHEIAQVLRAACAPEAGLQDPPGSSREVMSVTFPGREAGSRVPALSQEAQKFLDAAKAETKGCPQPGCARVNKAELALTIDPVNTRPSPKCPATASPVRFPANVTPTLDREAKSEDGTLVRSFKGASKAECQDQVREWTQAILQDRSGLGQYLKTHLCDPECTYGSEVRSDDRSKTSACDVLVKLSVRCGPPHASFGGPLFQTYRAKGLLRSNWSCEAKK